MLADLSKRLNRVVIEDIVAYYYINSYLIVLYSKLRAIVVDEVIDSKSVYINREGPLKLIVIISNYNYNKIAT